MESAEEGNDDLIGAVHEAALAPALWPSALHRMATEFGAHNGNFFLRERAQPHAAVAALDRMPFGVALTDGTGRMKTANAAVFRLAASGDLNISNGCLGTGDEHDSRQLAAAVRAAACPVTPRSQALALSRGPGRLPLIVAVLPISDRLTLAAEAADAEVCILIGDPDRRRDEMTPVLLGLFGLTPAEARLAIALAGGLSLSEVAAIHGISRETVRSQIKVIFQKTGTSRQQDLLRLLLAIPPLADPPFGG